MDGGPGEDLRIALLVCLERANDDGRGHAAETFQRQVQTAMLVFIFIHKFE